jgi:ADP-ribose pyrophosphatase
MTPSRSPGSVDKAARVLSSKVVFRGPVFQVVSDRVIEPGAREAFRRDIVRHQGSVVIMAVEKTDREPSVLLTRQYRYAAGKALWELPAGRIDRGEQALRAAQRELREETGYTAESWQRILFFYASPGFLDETMAIYLARRLKRPTAQPEDDEIIRKRFFPLSVAAHDYSRRHSGRQDHRRRALAGTP